MCLAQFPLITHFLDTIACIFYYLIFSLPTHINIFPPFPSIEYYTSMKPTTSNFIFNVTNRNLILMFATMSADTYSRNVSSFATPNGLPTVEPYGWDTKGVRRYIWVSNSSNTVVIAYKGHHTCSGKNDRPSRHHFQ